MYFAKVAASLGKKDKDEDAPSDSKKVCSYIKGNCCYSFILNISYNTLINTANIFHVCNGVIIE
jgi:hypothetical protein